MEKRRDVLIIGGGLGGTTLAVALAQAGLRVALVERLVPKTLANPEFDGRSYAIAHASARLLQGLSLWDAVADQAQPISKIVVTDGRAGQGASPLSLLFDGAEIEASPPGYILQDRYLRNALLTAVADAGVEHITGHAVEDHQAHERGATVTLSDGCVLEAGLVVAADGMTSPTAARAGLGRMAWGYSQPPFSCAITLERPHDGVAHQFFMPPGPLAILPLPGNRASIVWTEADARAQQISDLDDAGYLALLRPRIGSFLGDIALAGQRYAYPVPLSIAHQFHAARLALIGDAAHRVHPLAGQGLNAGLKDVAALAEVLTDAARWGEDLGREDVLARYTRWRRFDVATLAFATDSINRLFSNDDPILRLGRDVGLGVVNRLPGLRQRFMREAAGVTGDLPRLMRGLPL